MKVETETIWRPVLLGGGEKKRRKKMKQKKTMYTVIAGS